MQYMKRTGQCIAIAMLMLQPCTKAELNIRDHYSPRNSERPRRKATSYIVLHTTEGATQGSLDKIHRNGEAHYVVDTGGRVYRIIDRFRVAYHAGRSMWSGRRNVDEVSIGIEIVGFHNKNLTSAQFAAVRELLKQLKATYSIPDKHVMPHSMVAYGAPNRWHKRSHRGRKRCGMLLAKPSVRRKLGLYSQPSVDPDVRAGRLVVGDPYLHDVLFDHEHDPRPAPIVETAKPNGDAGERIIGNGKSAWDLARENYNSPQTKYVLPNGTVQFGNQITNWKRIPPGTRVIIDASLPENTEDAILEIGGSDGQTLNDIAGDEASSEGTIYFLSDGRVRTGAELGTNGLARLPAKTRVLVGYVVGGYITRTRSAYDVCGELWNAPSTIYRYPDGSIRYGRQVNENSIPRGTQVFFRN
jgi:N-acetylmuramoyl-L-alanine amidase